MVPLSQGIGNAHAYSITTDTLGNSYTSGSYTYIVDFDPGASVYTLSPVGLQDVFISKLDANGNFMCATSVGSTGNDISSGICADKKGNIYTTGSFTGTMDFDADPNVVFNITPTGLMDAFVYKVSETCLNTVDVKAHSIINNEILFYPNPAKESVNIVLPHKMDLYDESFQLILYDASGKQVLRSTIKNANTVLNLNTFSSGFYYAVVMHNGMAKYKQKLIIQ